jgi:hypothetical protein
MFLKEKMMRVSESNISRALNAKALMTRLKEQEVYEKEAQVLGPVDF